MMSAFTWSADDYETILDEFDGEMGDAAPLRSSLPVRPARTRSEPHGALRREQRRIAEQRERGLQKHSNRTLSRFIGHGGAKAVEADHQLPETHPAVVEGRTMFPLSRSTVEATPRLLVSGHNSAKLGKQVMKGAWRGLPLFHLTLEERATCPRSCINWRSCFGNAMPFTRRHAHGIELEDRLATELYHLSLRFTAGFVVRLHGLGDFYSASYAQGWADALRLLPQLRLFGYTAHAATSKIGRVLAAMNASAPGRCAIRFTVFPSATRAPMTATTVWAPDKRGQIPEGLVCPAQTGDTQACATCGLCWASTMRDTPIVFLGHGQRFTAGKS